MRKFVYLAYDLGCICVALVVALYLRHGIPLIVEGEPQDLYLLLLVTFFSGLFVLPLMRTHTSLWRYTSSSDLANVMIAVALVILVSNSSLFLISRLHMMPRSVPPMHWALAVIFMGGSRLLARQLFGPKRSDIKALKQHVIVVGAGHAAELYLQFIKRMLQRQIVVVGLVDSDKSFTGRVFQKHKILGTPEALPQLIEEFHVHGIQVKQVVLAQPLEELPEAERELLLNMERSGALDLVHFGKHMGPQLQPDEKTSPNDYYQNVTSIAVSAYEKPKGIYPYFKRAFDIGVGIVMLALLSPLVVLTIILVAIDVGLPVIFWQQRPGMYGKPFRLYKFRTMRPAKRRLDEDRLTHKSGDHLRTTKLGRILRRLRWDELPQLFHIIAGTMSFVGPRPLLPDDQPAGGELRLSVRPGVTGWAQIHGGDALSPEEKLTLDMWYIRHMSFFLDLRILLHTLIVVLKEDRPRAHMVTTTKETTKTLRGA